MLPQDIDTDAILTATRVVLMRLGHHPRVHDVAQELGCSALSLRRLWNRTGRTPLRDIIIFGCLTHSASLLKEGIKVEAAMRLSGFVNWTNFCHQFREFYGTTPGAYRSATVPQHRLEDGMDRGSEP